MLDVSLLENSVPLSSGEILSKALSRIDNSAGDGAVVAMAKLAGSLPTEVRMTSSGLLAKAWLASIRVVITASTAPLLSNAME